MNNLIGILSGMVMQRDEQNLCAITISAEAVGPLTTTLGQLTPTGENCWSLTGIPVGGPYTLTLADDETSLTFTDLYVGDLWLLGGQSNMEGVGEICDYTDYSPSETIRSLRWDNAWEAAHPILNQYWIAPYGMISRQGVHYDQSLPQQPRGVGPGYDFALEMQRRTGVPQGVLPCALGGSSLAQWNPDAADLRDENLYWIAMDRFRRAGSHVRGLFWHQGCSEAFGGHEAFVEKMQHLIAAFRRDCGNPALPVVQCQICRYTALVGPDADWNWMAIKERQRTLAEHIPHLDTVSTANATMADGIHLSTESQRILGRNAAECMDHLCFDPEGKRSAPAPRLDEVYFVRGRSRFGQTLAVRFANLRGNLTAPGAPTGFMVTGDPRVNDYRGIFRIELEGDTAYLRLEPGHDLRNKVLYYFFGADGYANITDEAGRPIPAFGPISLADIPEKDA